MQSITQQSPRHGVNRPLFPRRALMLALTVIAVIAVAFTIAFLATPGSASPAQRQAPGGGGHAVTASVVLTAVTCKSTHTYTETVSSAGTVRQKWQYRTGCGTHWQEWITIVSRSLSGAHYTEKEYRDQRSYPRWWEDIRKWAVSAKGVATYTHTVSYGG